MKNEKKYYLGLDIGTDSVGYAVTDTEYRLLKFHGSDAWGSHVFSAAALCDERRNFRSARRRLDRRQQRVQLLQEIFADEISKIDSRFFLRLSESYLWREDTADRYIFFNDKEYTDVQYMGEYPTIHHLISDLMHDKKKHDVRLVYLACAWLVAHRGHFLNQISVEHMDSLLDIQEVYQKFLGFFIENGFENPWSSDAQAIGAILKEHVRVTEKHNLLAASMLDGNDLHHAVDAYLNVVVGNVYHMRFSRQWFRVESRYSVKTKTLFTHTVKCQDQIVWNKEEMLPRVLKTAKKNTAHFTKYASFKTGGLFDQQPVKKGANLIPLKAGLPTEKYGGYNKAGVMFFIPVRYKAEKKTALMILSVELIYGKRFLEDASFAKEYAKDRLQRILGKKVDDVTFPLGMRPWKVNTVLSLDGFRACITGVASGGTKLIAQPIMQFSSDEYWKYYLKKVERLTEKVSNNPRYVYDVDYDVVHAEDNLKLYDLYIDKLQNTIYKKRINSPLQLLIDGRERFIGCNVIEQCQVLLNIHQVFGRMTAGCNLEKIGGKAHSAATVSFSSTMSNWKKNYSDVRIIDQSASGLWEVVSDNILEYV